MNIIKYFDPSVRYEIMVGKKHKSKMFKELINRTISSIWINPFDMYSISYESRISEYRAYSIYIDAILT